MLAHKHITKFVTVIVVIAVVLCFGAMLYAGKITERAGGTGVSMEYETRLFDTNEVMSVNIIMDKTEWNSMLQNASSETYYQCDVEINGTTFYRVGIRPKGNTSLTTIAADSTTDRYSLKLEFDQYVDGQTCWGLDKLILNNNYADATNMKEALIYDMYQYLGADASLYNYAKISVNGEYWGVYLALEAVEDSFLLRNYGVSNGELYKPESMNMGSGFDTGDTDFSKMTPPDQTRGKAPNESETDFNASQFGSDMPDKGDFDSSNMGGEMFGGMSSMMSGSGANLNYTDDDLDSYSTIWDGEVTKTKKADHKRVVEALKNISEGNNLEQYMDVDNLIKYMAVHVFSVNSDSLSGMMAHNYYIYEEDGKLNLLPWDYNLSFGGMGSGSDATSVVNDAIDNAFSGTKFFDTLMENEEYHQKYYDYLQQLVDQYLLGDGFETFFQRTRSQIDELVENDPTAFYSYDEYLTAVDTLYQVVKLRGQSIDGQVNGTIPSIASEQKNSDALVDVSSLDLSVMGSMDTDNSGGGSGFGFTKPASEGDEQSEAPADTAEDSKTPSAPASDGNRPEGFDPSQFSGQPPAAGTAPEFSGELPEGVDPSQFSGQMPEGFDNSQFGTPSGSDSAVQSDMNVPSDDSSFADGSSKDSRTDMPSFDGMSGMPGNVSSASGVSRQSNAVTYGVSLIVLLAGLLFAKFYRRRNRRR